MMTLKRVVVTGIGAITPLGNNLNDFWRTWLTGFPALILSPISMPPKFKTRFACELKGFDPLNYMDRKEARKLDRFAQTAIASSAKKQ